MNEFFETTTVHPATLPIVEREQWHRVAWHAEQDELAELTGVRQFTMEDMPSDVVRAIYDRHDATT